MRRKMTRKGLPDGPRRAKTSPNHKNEPGEDMKFTMKRTGAILAMAFAAAVLGGCKEEGRPASNAQSSPYQVPPGATPQEREDAYKAYIVSKLDRQFHVKFDDIAVRTATGREVRVNVSAYCDAQIGNNKTATDAYRAACRKAIGEKLMYGARHEDSISLFESYLPMGSAEIRPYNMFDEDMMLRSAAMHKDYDMYTVTDVHDCKTGERTPLMDAYRKPPEGGWPNEEARKKSQSVKPAIGIVKEGACKF